MSELLKKYESIDQSKLNEGAIKILNRVKTITTDFTTDDAKNNKIANDVLDEIMKKFPDSVKIVKRTPKAKPAPKKTHKASHTKKSAHTTTSTAKKSGNNIMSVAKEIQKAGESWKDAMERAKQVLKERREQVIQKQKTELEKLYALVKTKKELQGFAKSVIERDAVRTAKPRGARVVSKEGSTSNQYGTFSNKLGRKYWETRDRHADRLAPNYPKDMPLLASGGVLPKEVLKEIYEAQEKSVKGGFFPEFKSGYKYALLVFGNYYAIEIKNNFSKEFPIHNYIYDSEYKFLGGADSIKSKSKIENNKLTKSDFSGTKFVGYKYAKGGSVEAGDRVILTTTKLGKDYIGMRGVITDRKLLNDKYAVKLSNGLSLALAKDEFKHDSINPRFIDGGMTNLTMQNVSFAKGGSVKKVPAYAKKRLEELRNEIREERISTGEIIELQSLRQYIDPSDVELLQWAGVEEFEDDDNYAKGGKLTKSEVMRNMYKPSGDYFFEQKGNDLIVHLTSKDAGNSITNLMDKYDVKDNGKGYHGSSYILSRKSKLANGGSLPFMTDPNFGNFQNTGAFAKGGSVKKVPAYAKRRLEELREEIREERISTGEIAELQSLAQYIDPSDVELLEWAGVPEFEEEEEEYTDFSQYDTIAYNLTEEDAVKLANEQSEKDPNSQIVLAFTGNGFNVYVKKASFEKGGNIDGTMQFQQNDYERLVSDYSEDYPFFSVKSGIYWEIKKDKDEKTVAKWFPKSSLLKITRPQDKDLVEWLKRNSYLSQDEYEKFELGGAFMMTDLAGHTGGSDGLGNSMPLSGVSGTHYTGLVGETGAMSSGELFENGGGIEKTSKVEDIKNGMYKAFQSFLEGKISDEKLISTLNKLLGKRRWFRYFKGDTGASDVRSVESALNSRVNRESEKESMQIAIDEKELQIYNYQGNQIYEAGGAMAQNQQVINDASQSYVNYYLGEGASQGIYAKGGAIKNQYKDRTDKDIWNSFSITQRQHFLKDHFEEIQTVATNSGINNINHFGNLIAWANRDYEDLPTYIKSPFNYHTESGQYASGGSLGKALYVEYSSYFDSNKYDEEKIMSVLESIGAKNIRLENDRGWFNQPEVVVFNGNKLQAEDALNEAFDTYYIRVREKDWRTKKMADGGALKFKVGQGEKYFDKKEKMQLSIGKESDIPNVYNVIWEDGEHSIYSADNINFFISKGVWKKLDKMADGGFTPDVSDGTQFMSGVYGKGGETSRKGTYTNRIVTLDNGDSVMIGNISGYRGTGEPVYDVHKYGSLRKNILEKQGELSNNKIKELLKKDKYSDGGFTPDVSDGTQFMSGVYANGGGIRSKEELKKIFSEKEAIVKNLTPKQIAEMWNENSFGVKEGISKPITIEEAKRPSMKIYLENLLIENELTEDEQAQYFAKGGFVGTVEFNVGDTVWQKDEKRYATVMNNYGDPINGDYGDIRLDTTGNTSIYTFDPNRKSPATVNTATGYNLIKVGEKGDTGKFTPKVLDEMKESAKRLIDSRRQSKDKEGVAYYQEVYKRLLDGEFDSMTGAKSTASNKKGSRDYTYVPNKDVKELSVVVKGELKKLIGSDILDGVYVKNSAKSAPKVDANAVFAKILKDAKEAKSGKTKRFDASDLKKINVEMVKKLVDAGYTEQQIRNVIFGYAFDNEIVADNELEYDNGVFSYEESYVKQKIDDLVEAQKNKEFVAGIEYPDFDWQNIIKKYKITSKPKDIVIKRNFGSGSYNEYYYEVFVGENIALAHNFGYKDFGADGKLKEDYTEKGKKVSDPTKQNAWQKERGQKAGFNGGYWYIVSSKIETIDDILKTLLSQKDGYCKELELYSDSFPKTLKDNKISFADGGEMEVNNIDAELEDFDLDNLDPFETMQYNNFSKSSGKVGALQILINSVEGDYSQLSPELAELAEMQISQEQWDESSREMYGYAKGGMMAKGGMVVYLDGEKSKSFKTKKSLYEFVRSQAGTGVKKVEIDYGNRIIPTFDTYVIEDGKLIHKGELIQKNYDKEEAEKRRVETERNLNKMMGYANGGSFSDYMNSPQYKELIEKQKRLYAQLKSRVVRAVGIDEAIEFFDYEHSSIAPYRFIERAVQGNLITLDEINEELVKSALQETYELDSDEDLEEIGGSDFTYYLKNVLDGAGFKVGFVNSRLQRLNEDGSVKEIQNSYADGGFMSNVYADGGDLSDVDLNFDFETEGDAEEEYSQEVEKIKLLKGLINFDEVRGAVDYGKTKDNTNLRFYKKGKLVMTVKGDYDIDTEILDTEIDILGIKHRINYHPRNSMGEFDYNGLKRELDKASFADGGFMNNVYAKGGELKGKFLAEIKVPYNFEDVVENKFEFTEFLSKVLTKKWFGNGIWGVKIVKPLFERDYSKRIVVEIEIPVGVTQGGGLDKFDVGEFISKTLTKKWFGNGIWGVDIVKGYADGGSFLEDNEGFMRADNEFNYRYPEKEVYIETLDEPIDLTSTVTIKSNEVVISPIDENIDLNDDNRIRARMTQSNRGSAENFGKINPRAFEFIDLPMPTSNKHKND
jgi:gas vesicle protein